MATVYRYVRETVDLIASLEQVVRRAATLVWVILDGTLIPIDRVAEQRPYFNGHKRRYGVAGVRLLTATAGNHGRAVARMRRWLGIPTVVYLPAGADGTAIAAEGAEVRPVDGSYDEAVELAATAAHTDDRCLLVQDTAWPGHESAAGLVVEGYQTLFRELDGQLAGTAADVNHDVVCAEPERPDDRVNGGRRVPAPVLRVVGGHLAAEAHPHAASLPTDRLAARAVALRA